MAGTVTHGLATASTSNASSYVSGAFTPAANDLLVVFVVASGQTTGAGTLTSSVSGIRFTAITQATKAASADRLYAFVANAPARPVSQTVTFAPSSAATGAIIEIVRIAGIPRMGLDAIKQSVVTNNGAAAGTPSVTFGASCLTGNVTLVFQASALTTTTAVTPPTNWTEQNENTYSTPSTHCEYASRNSGFTGTSVTWGNANSTAWGAIGLEINAANATSLIATLTEDFSASTVDTTKWSVIPAAGTASQSSGALVLSPAPSTADYPGYLSKTGYDLTASSAFINIPSPLPAAASGNDSDFILTQAGPGDGSGEHRISVSFYQFGQCLGQKIVNGTTTSVFDIAGASITWFRLRHDAAGGRLHWETSTDGVTYTSQYNEVPPIALGYLACMITAGTWVTTISSPGSCTWDNLNVAPSSGTTHPASGAPAATAAQVAGTAKRFRTHATSGALATGAAVLAATAAHRKKHPSSGALAASAATLAATAAHRKTHPASGALAAQASAVAGTAKRFRAHASSGALAGAGRAALIAGNAAHQHRVTSAVLAGRAAVVAGVAVHRPKHATSGALAAQASKVTAAAVHPHRITSAPLAGRAALIAAVAVHRPNHAAAGALPAAQPAQLAGSATHSHVHAVGASALPAQAAQIAGTATRDEKAKPLHPASGALVAGPAQIAALALHPGPHVCTGALIARAAQVAGTAQRPHTVVGVLRAAAASLAGLALHAHVAAGALVAAAAQIAGLARREHASAGALVADASQVAGTAALDHEAVTHLASGALLAQRATLAGSARIGAELPTEPGGGRPEGIERFERMRVDHRAKKVALRAGAAHVHGEAQHTRPLPPVIDNRLANERRKTAALIALLLARNSGSRIGPADEEHHDV
jgi:hypothetical protein